MSTTIGTNVVNDGQELLNFIQSMLNELEKVLENRDLSKEQHNLKLLNKALRTGQSLQISDPQYYSDAKEIMKILDAKDIPYITIPSNVGGQNRISIVVREADAGELQKAAELTFTQNGRFYQELDFDTMLKDIKTEPIFKNQQTPVFEFKDSATRAMFTAELAKNDIPYAFDDNSGKVMCYPNQCYKEGGRDIATVITDMAVKYAIFSVSTDYQKYQAALAFANKETIQQFVDAATNGVNVTLEGMSGKTRIQYDDGAAESKKWFYIDNNDDIHYIPITKDMTPTQIQGQLAVYASDMTRLLDNKLISLNANATKNIVLAETLDESKLNYSQKVYLMTSGPTLANGKTNPYYLTDIAKASGRENALVQALTTYKKQADALVKTKYASLTDSEKCKKEINHIREKLKQDGLGQGFEKVSEAISENLDGILLSGSGDLGFNFVDRNKLEKFLGKEAETIGKTIDREIE